MSTATVKDKPFQHLVWKNFLDTKVYDDLDATWPDISLFKGAEEMKGKFDLRGAHYDKLSEPWKNFVTHLRPVLTEHGLNMLGLPNKGIGEPNWGRFMERSPGYVLIPHYDHYFYTVTFLFYMPQPEQIKWKGAGLRLFDQNKHKSAEIPYTPNTLIVFPNYKESLHSMTVPKSLPGGNRRVYQWHISEKTDDFGL